MRFSTVIGRFAYYLHLTALRFCMCHGLNQWLRSTKKAA